MIRHCAVVLAIGLALSGCGSDDAADGSDDGTASAGVSTTARELVTTAPASVESSVASDPQGVDLVFAVDDLIRFESGGTSATIANAVIRGERDRYTLEAAEGQMMSVSLTSVEGNAVFDLFGPDQVLVVAESTAHSLVLPADGAYTLIIGGTRGNASYELTVEIPAP